MNEVREKIIKIFMSSFVDVTNENVDLISDLGMDSLTFVQLIILIEEEFDIEIPFELLEINNFRNISLITDIVNRIIEGN